MYVAIHLYKDHFSIIYSQTYRTAFCEILDSPSAAQATLTDMGELITVINPHHKQSIMNT